ncbi:MAG: two pore domain potassium channel family protein [bacterium]|nr:two pore domain potassium channel family protein [bacterium]
MRKSYSIISFIASITVSLIPVIITFYHIYSYRRTLSSFIRLFSLMAQMVLLFATIYFVMQTISASKNIKENHYSRLDTDELPLNNISNVWYYRTLNANPDKLGTIYYALLSFQDCIHFSLVTASTLGYGDITPKSPLAKLVADLQVVLSFIIVAFGIGIFISSKADEVQVGKILDATEYIEKNLHDASNVKLQEWTMYSDLIHKKFHNLIKLIEDEQNIRKR